MDDNKSIFSTDPVKRCQELESFIQLLMARIARQEDEIESLQQQPQRSASK
jgi:prefoldin subunit 5